MGAHLSRTPLRLLVLATSMPWVKAPGCQGSRVLGTSILCLRPRVSGLGFQFWV